VMKAVSHGFLWTRFSGIRRVGKSGKNELCVRTII
jgi:hypothetical protein